MKCLKAAGRGPALRPIGDATGGCILETLGRMGGMVKDDFGDRDCRDCRICREPRTRWRMRGC